ncbi:2-keto-4-pentenoate hydratase [Alkalibacillus almallahensis]|uniref:2-keto-4-pentenoate hydratase n=1 Tax=Alkalibacillus almallahensis TaxID=1379154 RepID=UPI0014215251|nr:hydratase [Alkalibacillus almallahensis]NIK11687.1 2-keto-4-pentenoate hydratase [Alkalibacillus almallahensis]
MRVVDQLYNAYQGGPVLSRVEVGAKSLEQAYQLQKQVVEEEEKQGNPLAGYKISLTSSETQDLFGATEPLYGALLKDSIANNVVEINRFNEPLIEVELMFLIDQQIDPDDDDETIMQKTRVAPGIEIPDSRYEDWFPNLTLNQIVMDRAVAGKVVVGEPREGLTKADLNNLNVHVSLDQQLLVTGNSSDVMGNPLNAVKWLVDALARNGQRLEAGMVVSSGTFMLPKPLEKGVYQADFERIGEVKVEVI